MRNIAQLYKAFSEPVRLDMLLLLARRGELCVCDFEGALGLTQSTASRHLRHLYRAGLADHRRCGAWVHYRVRDQLETQQRALLEALLAHAPEERTHELDQALDAWLERKAGPACTCKGA
jgi:ArsR family transcriptional regulator